MNQPISARFSFLESIVPNVSQKHNVVAFKRLIFQIYVQFSLQIHIYSLQRSWKHDLMGSAYAIHDPVGICLSASIFVLMNVKIYGLSCQKSRREAIKNHQKGWCEFTD